MSQQCKSGNIGAGLYACLLNERSSLPHL
jgi:hypothetical protein